MDDCQFHHITNLEKKKNKKNKKIADKGWLSRMT